MTINFLYISLTWYCFVLTFVYSFIRRFTVRSCAIDRRKSDWIHRTGLSKPNYTRRFGTVNKALLILLDSFDFDRIRHWIKFRVLTESNVDFYHSFSITQQSWLVRGRSASNHAIASESWYYQINGIQFLHAYSSWGHGN